MKKTAKVFSVKSNYIFILLAVLWTVSLIFSLRSCLYGFSDDEPFYFTIPLRLLQGDALLVDEWHVSQLSGIFLLPYVFLFTRLNGCADGIVITARYVYLVIHLIVSIFLLLKLRPHGIASHIAALSFFLFAPHQIVTYYYNTMTMDFLVLSFLLISAEADNKPPSNLKCLLSGILFSCAVLCCPYLAAAYLLLAGFCFYEYIHRRRTGNAETFGKRFFLYFTYGVIISAALFLCFIFSRASISEIIINLPYIFADPEHPPIPLRDRLVAIFFSTWRCHPYFHYSLIAFAAIVVAVIFDRAGYKHRSIYFSLSILVCLFSYAIFLQKLTVEYYNAIMLPQVFIGFVSYLLCKCKPKKLFITFFACGIVYAVCICFSSNLFFLNIPIGISISNIASVVFASELIKELKEEYGNRSFKVLVSQSLLIISFIALLSMQWAVKYEHSYYQFESCSELKYQIEEGPAKGIYTNENEYTEYMGILNDLRPYKDFNGLSIYLAVSTWEPLYTINSRSASYSAWLSGETGTTLSRLCSYWALQPEKIPDYIYVPDSTCFNREELFSLFTAMEYSVTKLDHGIIAAKTNINQRSY